ncbi:hypothetical protein [Shewanella sp.]|uniref:hypothetical protein n=1 Tax=Shewanella sp. TaxID=50422 RepID=UPI003A9767EC
MVQSLALYPYIQAMVTASDTTIAATVPQIIKQCCHGEQISDDWSVLERIERTVVFADGAIIRQVTEVETETDGAAADNICGDDWISYQVLQQPPQANITPLQKQFTNRCQQAFWLKIQVAQQES